MTVGLTKGILARIDRDPIILSHHPLCGRFDDHMFKVKGRYLCIGCATVYPTALVAVSVLGFLNPQSFWMTAMIAVSLFGFSLIRFVVKERTAKIFFNIMLGGSLGATLFSAIYAPEGLRLVVVAVGLSAAATFSLFKGRRVFATCKSCERYKEFPSCAFPARAPATGPTNPAE